MAIKSRVVLPYLVPQLTAAPVNTKALSILASVAGDALTKYLRKILPALLSALSSAQGTPQQAQVVFCCVRVRWIPQINFTILKVGFTHCRNWSTVRLLSYPSPMRRVLGP